jgi:HAD superfamily hydrolase (TIGR01509 family)
MTCKAILFDLDGTLVDSIGLYEKAVIGAFKEQGLTINPEEYTQWYRDAWHLTRMLQHFGRTETDTPGIRERRDTLYMDLLRTDAVWIPGAEETLEALRTAGMPMALVTGSWKSYVDALDERLDLERFFPVRVTMDDVGKLSKPHPQGLLIACERLKVEPSACLYIGDQMFDVEAAHNAGMPCWAVQGRFSPSDLAEKAERMLGSIRDAGECLA